MQTLLAMAPLFAMMVVAAVVAPMMLGGWLLSGKAVSPNFGKLDPLAGIARMFSTQSLAELVKALAKSLLIGGVAYLVIMDDLEACHGAARPARVDRLAAHHHAGGTQLRPDRGRAGAGGAGRRALAALEHHKKLRMSREDVRQEHKESEGDPHIKAQIRRQQQAIAKRRMMAEVPKADIVVTNPTHFAVALKYVDGDMRAPRVVAKGTDLVAQRIREIAADNKVAILEAPPLTRALYKHTPAGRRDPRGPLHRGGRGAGLGLPAQALEIGRRRGAAQADRQSPFPKNSNTPSRHERDDQPDASADAVLLRQPFKGLAGPILIIMILAMMVLPLPPFLLDLLFTLQHRAVGDGAAGQLYTIKAARLRGLPGRAAVLDPAAAVAQRRLHPRGADRTATPAPDAAGKVIEAFGHFLVGGNYAVGIVVFIILIIINFIVITKGAGRIAEVGARFTLDAMPGKQMAIDADLNAGLIGEDEARKRRTEVAQEADFYGSMDGASKFVRGDAVAGIMIMVINIIGGLVVGVVQHDLAVRRRRPRPTRCWPSATAWWRRSRR